MGLHYVLLIGELILACVSGTDYSFTINEDSSVDTLINDFDDLACDIGYSFMAESTITDCCSITTDGELRVAQSLDRETTISFSGILECRMSSSPYYSIHNVEVVIDDVNDVSPYFSSPTQTASISEKNSVPSRVTLSGATDEDSQQYSVERYELQDYTDIFSLESGTWSAGTLALTLLINQEMDYDDGDVEFVLNIVAYDAADNQAAMTLTLSVTDINDNKPVFNQSIYSGSVSEDTASQKVVVTVSASDADSGNNGAVQYSLSGDDIPFVILDNGDIIVTQALDRETVSSYTFQVAAEDGGDPAQRTSVTVVVEVLDVNDNQPVISSPTALQVVEIRENQDAGSIVCGVQISDADEGENSRLTVAIAGSYSSRFEYVAKQGDIGQIVTTQVLDREDTPLYTLIISASDNGVPVLSKEVQFTLKITDDNDNTPEITNCDQDILVTENLIGEVFTVAASDPDTGVNAELLYAVESSTRFTVAEDGVLSLVNSYDYEVDQEDTVRVRVSDSSPTAPLSAVCDFRVEVADLNDNPPLFGDQGDVSVAEDVAIGTTITTLTATDPDAMDAGNLEYQLLGSSDVFMVNSASGEITTTAQLDRETGARYTLDCVVYDTARLHNATTLVTVVVADVSDTAPVFTGTPYLVNISETVAVTQVIFRVAVSDADVGDVLTFSSDSTYFGITPDTGEVYISTTVASSSPSSLAVDISVSDGLYTVQTSLTVIVYKDDGAPPSIVRKSGLSLSESVAAGTTAGQCSGAASSPITYSLVWDLLKDYQGLFTIDAVSGRVSTTGSLDYEAYQEYLLMCSVTDIHGNTAQASLTVTVEGANEFAPVFKKSFYNFQTDDNVKVDRTIGTVDASDGDKGNDGILQFYLNPPVEGWEIDIGSGNIIQLSSNEPAKRSTDAREERSAERVKRADDEPSSNFHKVTLSVGVEDSPSNPANKLSDTATVVISVYQYTEEGDSGQMILLGAGAGGGLLLLLLVLFVIFFIIKRRRARSGSKELTYVNPTAVTDKEGRNITSDGGYHSSDMEKQQIVLTEFAGFNDVEGALPYSKNELKAPGYSETALYEAVDGSYPAPQNVYNNTLNLRDKLSPHKMSVSTVLSDMRHDVQITALPRRMGGSMTHSTSYESVHVFGSEGGGEGDAVIDAHSLFNKLSEIDDDISVQNKSHFLGDQDSAFSSLGSSDNGEITTYHSDYLQDWKPAFQSVGTVCEGMLRHKQFAYKSSRSGDSVPTNQNTAPAARDHGSSNEGLAPVPRDLASSLSPSRDEVSVAASCRGSNESNRTRPSPAQSRASPAQSRASPAQSVSSANL